MLAHFLCMIVMWKNGGCRKFNRSSCFQLSTTISIRRTVMSHWTITIIMHPITMCTRPATKTDGMLTQQPPRIVTYSREAFRTVPYKTINSTLIYWTMTHRTYRMESSESLSNESRLNWKIKRTSFKLILMTQTIHRRNCSVRIQRKWSTHPIFVRYMSQPIRHWHRWMGKCLRLDSVRTRRMQRWRHCSHCLRFRRCPINFRMVTQAMRAAHLLSCRTTAWASVWAWTLIRHTAMTNCRRWACRRRTTIHRPRTPWAASVTVRWAWCRRTNTRSIYTSRRNTVSHSRASTFRLLAQWMIRHCRRNLRTAKTDYIHRKKVCRPMATILHMVIIAICWTVLAPVQATVRHCKATVRRWVRNLFRCIRPVPVAAGAPVMAPTISMSENGWSFKRPNTFGAPKTIQRLSTDCRRFNINNSNRRPINIRAVRLFRIQRRLA